LTTVLVVSLNEIGDVIFLGQQEKYNNNEKNKNEFIYNAFHDHECENLKRNGRKKLKIRNFKFKALKNFYYRSIANSF
jgi:hypothetical protein